MSFNHKSLRYFCIDNHNQDLFFISLDSYDEISDYIFCTSLDFDLESVDGISELIEELCLRITTDERRALLIQILFKSIQAIPGIEKKYLPTFLLDKQGKYMEHYLGVLREIL